MPLLPEYQQALGIWLGEMKSFYGSTTFIYATLELYRRPDGPAYSGDKDVGRYLDDQLGDHYARIHVIEKHIQWSGAIFMDYRLATTQVELAI